jgi:hypothetical protein
MKLDWHMKRHLLINLILLISPGLLLAQVEKLYPGMTAESFRNEWPGVLPGQVDYNSDLEENVKLNGSEGKLHYRFRKNVLANMEYNSSEGSTTLGDDKAFMAKANDLFQKYLLAAQKTVEELTALYGKPAVHKEENIYTWNAPKNRNSTHFVSASWLFNGKEAVRLSCYFSGIPEVMHPNEPGVYPLTYNLTVVYETPCDKTNWELHPGMTAKACADKKAALFPNGVNVNGTFEKKQNLNGIDGNWSFCFYNGVLHHASYYYNLSDEQDNSKVNEKSFGKIYDGALKLQKQYDKKMGGAVFLDVRNRNLAEALKLGTSCIAADWKKDMQVELRYDVRQSNPKGFPTRSLVFELIIYNPADNRPYQCPN